MYKLNQGKYISFSYTKYLPRSYVWLIIAYWRLHAKQCQIHHQTYHDCGILSIYQFLEYYDTKDAYFDNRMVNLLKKHIEIIVIYRRIWIYIFISSNINTWSRNIHYKQEKYTILHGYHICCHVSHNKHRLLFSKQTLL